MKGWRKQHLANQPTLDQFLQPKPVDEKETIKRACNKIKVPPSSGLPPLVPSLNAVLRYPTRPEFREYQQQIVCACITSNTLVCLPTGLGKTHIAAVIIANFSRWFPEQKIVFLAPTRPLVNQQASALKHLGDQVAQEKTLEVTGQLTVKKRELLYEKHQVIFATPQTIQNDLRAKRLDGRQIILLVFDECHRAVGGYSYTKIIQMMNTLDVGFRVVGLSATPGSEIQKIQEVVTNLNIKRIVYKDENDKDVKRYLHEKTIRDVVIEESSIIRESLAIIDKFAGQSINILVRMRLAEPWMLKNGLASASFFLLREKFKQNISGVTAKEHKAIAYSAFSIISFLIRCRKALNDQGYQTFKNIFFAEIDSQKIIKSKKNEERKKAENEYFSKVQENQEGELSLQGIYDYYPQDSKASAVDNSMVSSLPKVFIERLQQAEDYKRLKEMFYQGGSNMHPKLLKTAEILQSFFAKNQGKAIVFTQHRISAKQIKDYLADKQAIRSELFMGQAKTLVRQDEETGESCFLQLKQKQQLEVIERYKRGDINTLISTSIGQEGLDIGEVDCIICYDGGHSPIRAIQRRGRTGRKRAGEVYIMLMEGKEHTDYKKGVKRQQKMKDILKKQTEKFQYFAYNSSLFEENSIIKIEYYENVLAEEKSGKVQEKPEEQDGKKTKKMRRGSKKEKEADDKEKEKEQDQSQEQQEQSVEIKVTTIGSLLNKYKDPEQAPSFDDSNTFDAKLQQKQQTYQQQQDQSDYTEQKCSEPIASLSQVQSDQQESPKVNIAFDFDDLQTAPEDQQQSSIKLINQSDSSDEEDLMTRYFLNKKQEQAAALTHSNDSQDSESQQLLEIVQNYIKKRELRDVNTDSNS